MPNKLVIVYRKIIFCHFFPNMSLRRSKIKFGIHCILFGDEKKCMDINAFGDEDKEKKCIWLSKDNKSSPYCPLGSARWPTKFKTQLGKKDANPCKKNSYESDTHI